MNGLSFEDNRQYRQYMVAEAAIQLGCREMGINAEDLVICQFLLDNDIPLLENNGVALAVESMDEAAAAVERMGETEYQQ